MGRRAWLGIAAGGILVMAGVLVLQGWFPARDDAPSSPEQPVRSFSPSLTWMADARQVYGLQVTTEVRIDSAGQSPRTTQQVINARLHLRVLSVDGDVVTVAFQLAELETTGAGWSPDATRDLLHPLVARFTVEGEIRDVRFAADAPPLARQQLAELLRTFQVVIPDTAETRWTVEERHARGRYTASYTRDDGPEIVKRKTAYVEEEVASGVFARVDIRTSLSVIRLLPRVSWVARMTVEEDLVQTVGDQLTLASKVRARLERDASIVPIALAIDGDKDGLLSGLQLAGTTRDIAVPGQPPAPGPGGVPTAKETTAFRDTLAAFNESGGRRRSLVYELRKLLREYPALAELVLELLDDATLDSATVSELFHLLEVVGTPEAQRVLQQVTLDATHAHQNRLRAVIALGGTAHPTDGSLDALWGVAEQRVDSAAVDLSNTASLSLGRLGSRLRREAPDRYDPLRDRFLGRLGSSSHNLEKANVLSSLGNTHDPSLSADVTPYLSATSSQVRDAAAGALGSMRSDDAVATLTGRLPQEPDGGVRSSIVGSLERLEARDAASVTLVRDLASREPDAQARFSMVRYLVGNLDADPSIRPHLERLLANDKSERIRVYLTRELRGAAGASER